jgi:hypothetical protein
MIRPVLSYPCAGFIALTLSCAHAGDREDKHEDGYGKFEFALIGDTPYRDVAKFENVLAAINADRKIRFVLHAGDIKTGSSACSDELFADRLERFNRFEAPFVYTPGDNEWTDCHRVAAGQYQPLERLAKLREVFYPVPGQTLGQKSMEVETQASDPAHGEFVEHLRWTRQHVTFATLHVVGSQNALDPFDPKSTAVRTQADDDEVARRIAATLAWIRGTFAQATAEKSRGVLFLFQADPNFEFAPATPERKGFDEVLAALQQEAIAFGKPVVLAHGDSHYMRVDKPVRSGGAAIPNMTRVETFGDADYHWLRVVVDPNSPEVFSVHQEIVEANW